jgi:hypothetical protein
MTALAAVSFQNKPLAKVSGASQPVAFGRNRCVNKFGIGEHTPKTRSDSQHFSWHNAVGHFVKGVMTPIRHLVEKPLLSTALILGTMALSAGVPVLLPVMVGVGLLFSTLQAGSGVYAAIDHAQKGEYAQSEKAFEDIGSGTFGIVSSALGLKKAATEALSATRNIASAEAASEVAAMSQWQQAKTCFGLFTRKEGLTGLLKGIQQPAQFVLENKDMLLQPFNLKSSCLKSSWAAKPVEVALSLLSRMLISVMDYPTTHHRGSVYTPSVLQAQTKQNSPESQQQQEAARRMYPFSLN